MTIDYKFVRYEKRDRVAYITLNRPEVLNAMNLCMHEELCAIWDDFEKDETIWVGVLSGEGERAFSVGQDIKELVYMNEGGELPSSFGSRGRPGWPRLTERHKMSKPILAKVHGYALGGGMELALACDLIIAADDASFALPEAKLGLIPGAGGLFRLPRQIPSRIAAGYLMTGRHMSAMRAYELGLINDLVPAASLNSCVDGWLADILRCAPLSVRTIKEVMMGTAHLELGSAFSQEYVWDIKRRASLDCIEGPSAFIEKRAPRWQAT